MVVCGGSGVGMGRAREVGTVKDGGRWVGAYIACWGVVASGRGRVCSSFSRLRFPAPLFVLLVFVLLQLKRRSSEARIAVQFART